MKKIFSLFAAILFAGSMWGANYAKTAISDITATDVVIIVGTTSNGNSYAMKNTGATSSGPAAISVTITDDVISTDATDILWNISKDGDNLTLRPNADTKNVLYCISNNNGLRIAGSTASGREDGDDVFVLDNTYQKDNNPNKNYYLKSTLRTRWIGIYNTSNWRSYTSINSNIGNQSFAFYVLQSTPSSACATPTFSPAAGTYTSAQSVTISTTTEDATIYYTMGDDPAEPTTADAAYTGAIEVSETTTIKAIAVKDGLDNSSVASATYTIVTLPNAGTAEDPYTVAVARQAIDLGVGLTGVYAQGTISQIDEYKSNYKSITYWISDDGTTTDQLQVYSGKGVSGADFSSESDLRVGDEVIVTGNLKKYNSIYEFDANNQLYSLVARTPNFTISDVEFRSTEAEDLTVLDLTVNKESEGAVTFVSSLDETVATVTETAIHPEGAGDVIITAKLAAAGIYRETTTTFTIHFIDPCHNNITLSKGTTEHGSFTLSREEGEYPTCDEALTVVVTPTADAHYHVLSVLAPNSESISGPDANGKYTVTYAQNTNATSEINVTFDEDEFSTVTWDVNNNSTATTTSKVYNGEKPVFPTTPAAFDEKSTTFYGWADDAWAGQAPDLDADVLSGITIYTAEADLPEVDGDVTYYAVFAQTTGSVEPASFTSVFTSKSWGDEAGLWTSGKDGGQLLTGRGVQVTKTVASANATTKASYSNVSSVVVTYSTNASTGAGEIAIQVGETEYAGDADVTTEGGTDDREITYTAESNATGAITITVTCTTNSIYVKSVEVNYSASQIFYGRFTVTKLDPTSVDNTDATKKAVKFIQNGQLFIEMNGRIYNVQGQTVK